MGDEAAAASAAEGEEATEGEEREMEGAAADMEEGAEARVGVALAAEVEDPEVPRVCGCAMTHICLPCPFGTGNTTYYPGGDSPTHSPGSRSLQELAPVRNVL